jgi:WD40 repeat protein
VGQVFISYARADRDYVHRLAESLIGQGIPVWYDVDITPGREWNRTLQEHVETCAAVLVVMTPAAYTSYYVHQELDLAEQNKRPIVPLLRDGDPFPRLENIQYDDVRPSGIPSSRVIGELRRLTDVRQPPLMTPVLPDGTVDRPDVITRIVDLLLAGPATIGVTTGLVGAGGFGKTTAAILACHHPVVVQRFPGGVLWAELGEHPSSEHLALIINGLCHRLTAGTFSAADPRDAGRQLGDLLSERPATLLVLDDVWRSQDLDPFRVRTANPATLLVTTRIPDVLPRGVRRVRVDEMSRDSARELLSSGLAPLASDTVERLLTLTGGWALLIAQINGRLDWGSTNGADITAVAAEEIDRLAEYGPAGPDLSDSTQRKNAIAASIERSLVLLTEKGRHRYRQLAIFPEDSQIHRDILSLLWNIPAPVAGAFCEELARLSLIQSYRADQGSLRLHDVLRSLLRHQLSPESLRNINHDFLDHAAAVLMGNDANADEPTRPWWTLSEHREDYLWRRLTYHLTQADLRDEKIALLSDLRWTEAKIRKLGSTAAVADDLTDTTEATLVQLRMELVRHRHLLGPIDPVHSHADILVSRLDSNPNLHDLICRFTARLSTDVMRLTNAWPLPDTNPATIRTLTANGEPFYGVAIAPDGTWLAAFGQEVWIWDAATGNQRAETAGLTSRVTGMTIAPDSTWLVTFSSMDGSVRIWDAASGAQRALLAGRSAWVDGVAIAPDGTWLVTIDGPRVRTFDAATGDQRAQMTGHAGEVNGVAIAPDGIWLATAGADCTVRIWEAATGTQLAELAGHTDSVRAVAIAPDGAWLATAGTDRTVRIWDVVTGGQRARLTGHTGTVTGVAIAPDGAWLATTSEDNTLRIWDGATGGQRAQLAGDIPWVAGVAIASDGTWLATTNEEDRTVRIWDVVTGSQRARLAGHASSLTGVAIAPDGTWLATASYDCTVRVWDAAGGAQLAPVTDRTGGMRDVSFAPDGSWLVTIEGKILRIWDAAAGIQRVQLAGHTDYVNGVAIAPDGAWLATTSRDQTARIWDAASGSQRVRLVGNTDDATRHPTTGGELRQVQLRGSDPVERLVAIAPDSTWLVTIDETIVRIWDVASGTQRAELAGHTNWATGVAIAPDGTWLVTIDGRIVRIWDAATGSQRAELAGHTSVVTGVAIAPDGTWLASTSQDHTGRIWDPATGSQRAQLAGHTSAVTGVAIAPDGTWLATISWDHTARIWDPATGSQRAELADHTDVVNGVAIAPDGTWLATTSFDQTVRIWNADRCTAAMRVDGPLTAIAISPDGKRVHTVGGHGIYAFDLYRPTKD